MSNKNNPKQPYNIESIKGNVVDIVENKIFPGEIFIENGKIKRIKHLNETLEDFIIPGFVDSHIHIESSMLVPSEFARTAVTSGTIAVVADPHEITNVMGTSGIDFMIENGRQTPFKFYFSAPSCVPATDFETSGAKLGYGEVQKLMQKDEIKSLGEVMNVPGVLKHSPEIINKIDAAKKHKKPVDGHAPQLSSTDLKKYISAGISTDHECTTIEEALEKIMLGMKIQIREGSAAKDFDALSPLLKNHSDFCMFSSDDKHPNELVKGHINLLVKKAIKLGYDKMKVLRCASLNPIKHYNLDVGLLQQGDCADFLIIDNFDDFNIKSTVINGLVVSENGWSLINKTKVLPVNNFCTKEKSKDEFKASSTEDRIRVIQAFDGQLITKELLVEPKIKNGEIICDTTQDILKVSVVNRYRNEKPAVGFIKGFGLKKGAIASSVAHDSHNVIAIGTNDDDLQKAINLIIKNKGGLCTVNGEDSFIIPLPVAGIMSDKDGFSVAQNYAKLESKAKSLGTKLSDPFMTMSFMTLLVIPELKISDKGLFSSK